MTEKLLTKKEVLAAVNKVKGLRLEFKPGSWDRFAGHVRHVGSEPLPDNPLVSRYLYDPAVVRSIADRIGYVEDKSSSGVRQPVGRASRKGGPNA